MKRFPTMTSTVHHDDAHRRFVVVVEHSMYQSYIKAVFPKAKRDVVKWLESHQKHLLTYVEGADLGAQYTKGTEDLSAEMRRMLSLFYITY